ncbi:MAG: hypothetical protein ACXAC8_11520 [Candidatus Hodarchaeales archaeon]
MTPTHTYLETGLYTATLTVTDDDAGIGTMELALLPLFLLVKIFKNPKCVMNESRNKIASGLIGES